MAHHCRAGATTAGQCRHNKPALGPGPQAQQWKPTSDCWRRTPNPIDHQCSRQATGQFNNASNAGTDANSDTDVTCNININLDVNDNDNVAAGDDEFETYGPPGRGWLCTATRAAGTSGGPWN